MASEVPLTQRPDAPGGASFLALASFTAAVFMSALLLFAVQPMFARMVLPRFGGSPAVWSVAMVFFQTMLLAGYAYAHYLMRVRQPVLVIGIHLALMAVAGVTLPLSLAEWWGTPPSEYAAIWLLGLFTVSIGLPFFALSANNPLLQAWFSRTGHHASGDPYFLYAASNVGSFLALLSYPVLLEPLLPLRDQSLLWSTGFWLLFVLIAWCGFLTIRSRAWRASPASSATSATAAPGWWAIGRWMFLAAVPSGLLVAVTAHISTDVAAIPLLWVVPLSLYLLTWVLVFQSRPLVPHKWLVVIHPLAIVGLVALLAFDITQTLWLNLTGHLVAFFLIAMAAHGELARQRPAAEHLTTFYLALSAGGMVGGLFAGLIAPQIFSWIAEYPILIVLAALCRPMTEGSTRWWDWLYWVAAVAVAIAIVTAGLVFEWRPVDQTGNAVLIATLAVAAAAVLVADHPYKFAIAIAVALAMVRLFPANEEGAETVRSFFGVHKIYDTADAQHRILMHGTTVHGAQKLAEDGTLGTERPEPLTYYHAKSGLAQAIGAVRKRKGGPLKVAVVGLGSGTLACYVEPTDTWKFFEIDPSIVEIARDYFSYLQHCAPNVPIVMGDGRLTLAREPDGQYDLIIVDAYSSDSIPIHLATREAMALYKSKLAPDGVVVLHISNRHLELASVAAGIASANGLKTWFYDGDKEEDQDEHYKYSSEVAISAARPEDIGELAANEQWKPTEPNPRQRVWTDDYSNIVSAIIRRSF